MDHLDELDKKINTLIKTVEQLKQENAGLMAAATKGSDELAMIKSENSSLKNDLESIKASTREQQEKVEAATEKIKNLIAKIDAA